MATPGDQFFRVYPNPTSGEFTVELISPDQPGKWSVEVYNLQGIKVHSATMEHVRSARITLEGLSDGIYLVKAGNDYRSGIWRIVMLP
jgi:hypothetical protein